jgi:hypothetical protein
MVNELDAAEHEEAMARHFAMRSRHAMARFGEYRGALDQLSADRAARAGTLRRLAEKVRRGN